jgi:uncharacterized Zn-finger protein
LKRHMNSIHSDKRREWFYVIEHNNKGLKITSSGFSCSATGCGKGFSRRDNMRQHMNIHRPEDFPPGTYHPATKRPRVPRGSSCDL